MRPDSLDRQGRGCSPDWEEKTWIDDVFGKVTMSRSDQEAIMSVLDGRGENHLIPHQGTCLKVSVNVRWMNRD